MGAPITRGKSLKLRGIDRTAMEPEIDYATYGRLNAMLFNTMEIVRAVFYKA